MSCSHEASYKKSPIRHFRISALLHDIMTEFNQQRCLVLHYKALCIEKARSLHRTTTLVDFEATQMETLAYLDKLIEEITVAKQNLDMIDEENIVVLLRQIGLPEEQARGSTRYVVESHRKGITSARAIAPQWKRNFAGNSAKLKEKMLKDGKFGKSKGTLPAETAKMAEK